MEAFRLTKEVADQGFTGGTINLDTHGHLFSIHEALDKGAGLIITDNLHLASVLSSYPGLERIPPDEVPEDAQPLDLSQIPLAAYLSAPAGTVGPPQPQTPQPTFVLPPDATSNPIAAEHADTQDDSIESAVQAGQEVSGPGLEDEDDDEDQPDDEIHE